MVWLRKLAGPASVTPTVLVFLVALSAQESSPLSGTWRLNVAKSTFNPAAVTPKSGTVTLEVSADTIKQSSDGINAQGQKTHSDYTARFDGKDHPWKGTLDGQPNPSQDAVAWKKVDEYSYELTSKLKGQVLTTARVVVAKGGKTATVTITGKDAKGQAIKHTALYEKQ